MAELEHTVTEAFLDGDPLEITPAELVEFCIDHGQQLAAMALSADCPKAAALFTLAVAELRGS